jgi:hypothetical protein
VEVFESLEQLESLPADELAESAEPTPEPPASRPQKKTPQEELPF